VPDAKQKVIRTKLVRTNFVRTNAVAPSDVDEERDPCQSDVQKQINKKAEKSQS
jgi:hypothetical protein